MIGQHKARVSIIISALSFVPIPSFMEKINSSGLAPLAEEAISNHSYIAFSPRMPFIGQIIGGMWPEKIRENTFVLSTIHRLRITAIVADQGNCIVAEADIIDYLNCQRAPLDQRQKDTIALLRELCEKMNRFGNVFKQEFFTMEFSNLGEFTDNVAVAIIIFLLSSDETRILSDAIFGVKEQEVFLSELNFMNRANHLQRILQEAIITLNNLDRFTDRTIPSNNRSIVPVESQQTNKKVDPENGEKTKGGGGVKVPVINQSAGREEHPFQFWKRKVEEANLPSEVLKEALIELNKLARPNTSDADKAFQFLECVCELPWHNATEDSVDIDAVRRVLDEDHFGLEEAKERILEYLAVKKLNPELKGPILCFLGPPGTGKTSLAHSIARAIGRKFVRISLGGINDEAELRGHRRTYVGALPGKIISCLRKVGVKNPVFILDEIDKVGKDRLKGDPEAALLEILDPEQNFSFIDHFINAPFDLSEIFFIATGNVEQTVSLALRDRMEIIHFDPYTLPEKMHIAKKHLIPKQRKQNGLSFEQIIIENDALERIIYSYTRESGVRNLEREIGTVCRKVAIKVAKGDEGPHEITLSNIHEYLGAEKFKGEQLKENLSPGVAIGLAATPMGDGHILFIETHAQKSSTEGFILTGCLEEVIEESAIVARTLVSKYAAELGLPSEEIGASKRIHIHIPAAGIKKDGPSAGVTIAVALASLFTKKPVRPFMAFTGEITLRGDISPVGGLKQKVIAAKKEGVKEIVVPLANKSDIENIQDYFKEGLVFHFVSDITEVFKIAFEEENQSKRLMLRDCL